MNDKFTKTTLYTDRRTDMKGLFECYYYDQEPFYPEMRKPMKDFHDDVREKNRKATLIANSEKSEFKDQFIRQTKHQYDWYYFFHGFAALDWYRDFQYYDPESFEKFDKVFICYNHLISNYRSYRLHLVANMIEEDIVDKGSVSFFLRDKFGTWQDAVADKNSLLSMEAKEKITKNLSTLTGPLLVDTADPNGALSATVSLGGLTKALWHVVNETVYFHPKLHLTEKVFKPIVAKRPFLLVGAVGNLAYLKSYGFKTFDRWVDESYDQEPDNFKRIEMITAELKKLCNLSRSELIKMHQEMKEILDYNHAHFYGEFKKIIVDELVENFNMALAPFNNGRMPGNHSKYHIRYELTPEQMVDIKRRLMQ